MAKRGSAPARTAKRRGLPLLAVAWAVAILVIGGNIAWRQWGGGAPAARRPPEPFFMVLEPEAPPAPPPAPVASDNAAPPPAGNEAVTTPPMPAMPAAKDVPELAAKPPQDRPATVPPSLGGGTPAKPPAPPQPPAAAAAPPAAPPPDANPPKANPPPAPDQQTAAAVVPPPLPPQAQPPAQPPSESLWQKLASPFDANDARPRVAVVIVDLGLSSAATQTAIQNLPAAVSLGFSPYADNLPNWVNLARAAGHEVLLGLPMEPANFPTRDPGPQTLLTSLSPRENIDRLDWVLGRAQGYVGVTNYMGSRFTTSAQALRPVLTTLRDRGLMFVDARTTPRSEAARLATEVSLPRAINDRMIDEQASRAAIDAMLADIERVAKQTGNAVAMGQPYPVTFERLAAWLPTLDGKGFALAPITAMVNRQPDG
ncbi:MAG TPA: divergent polysaccharide deacetylase family protein [Alphaproteobacteria bacterium]|nr:divergent polysaccharide deacetylase family protein [Alphaproteobacteria bacterium]